MSDRTCSIDGCDRKPYCRGLCLSHYERQRVAGKVCNVEGCDSVANGSRGMCNKHYLRWRNYGTTDWISTTSRENPNTICLYSGCTNGSVRISGYCPTHEFRIRRYGDPSLTANPRFLPFFHMVTADKVRRAINRLAVDPDTGCWNVQTKEPRARINLGDDGTRIVYARVYQVVWAWWHQRDPMASIDHLCENPRCCNPQHLEEVSDQENILRYFRRRREA